MPLSWRPEVHSVIPRGWLLLPSAPVLCQFHAKHQHDTDKGTPRHHSCSMTPTQLVFGARVSRDTQRAGRLLVESKEAAVTAFNEDAFVEPYDEISSAAAVEACAPPSNSSSSAPSRSQLKFCCTRPFTVPISAARHWV